MKYMEIDKKKIAGLVLLLLGSCTYGETDLYNRQRGKVTIALDWGEAAVPDSAAFYFYPFGENIAQVRMAGGNGFEGTLPAGRYQVMVVNTTHSGLTLYTDRGYDKANAYVKTDTDTNRTQPREDGQQLIVSPLDLCGAGLSQVTVGKEPASYVAYPVQQVFSVRLDVVLVGTLSIDRLEGELSGVAASVHIPTATPDFSEPAAVGFDLKQQAPGRFRSSATVLGLHPKGALDNEKAKNHLRLYVWLADQRRFVSELDVTALVKEAMENQTEGVVAATIKLALAVDPSKPQGFDLQIVEWNTGTGWAGEEEY